MAASPKRRRRMHNRIHSSHPRVERKPEPAQPPLETPGGACQVLTQRREEHIQMLVPRWARLLHQQLWTPLGRFPAVLLQELSDPDATVNARLSRTAARRARPPRACLVEGWVAKLWPGCVTAARNTSHEPSVTSKGHQRLIHTGRTTRRSLWLGSVRDVHADRGRVRSAGTGITWRCDD